MAISSRAGAVPFGYGKSGAMAFAIEFALSKLHMISPALQVGGNPASGEFCRGTAISVFGEFTAQGKVFVADLSGIGHRHW